MAGHDGPELAPGPPKKKRTDFERIQNRVKQQPLFDF